MGSAAAGPRAISLELGGKSPLVIFDDAHLDSAVEWVMTGFLWGSGQVGDVGLCLPVCVSFSLPHIGEGNGCACDQVCSCTSRVLVHSSVRAVFMEKLLAKVSNVKIGNSLGPEMEGFEGPQMGPLVNKSQYDKVCITTRTVAYIF